MSRLLYPFVRLAVGRGLAAQRRRALVPAVIAVCSVTLALAPQYAAAEAVAGPEPTQGPSGLPEGRVYQQASPQNKNGNEAGAPGNGQPPYMWAGVGGDEVAYLDTGPLGQTPSGFDYFSIAKRSPTGWHSRAAVSRGEGQQGAFKTNPEVGIGFSAEMGASVFGATDVFVPEQAPSSPTPRLYKYNEDGSVQWIGKPTIAEPATLELGIEGGEGYYASFGGDQGKLAGASPDFNTIYYAFEGVLTSAEEEGDPALGNVSRAQELMAMNLSGKQPGGKEPTSNEGFYEWHEGTLEYAGVLPDGHIDPYGAVPAATGDARVYSAEALGNQVSEDARKAFFLSPDPNAGSGRPSELYERETAADGTQLTALVSRDLLLARVEGLPAESPSEASFDYASPDGSRVFFKSASQLTSQAPSGESTVKQYMFDTQTNTLSYLPGVADWTPATCSNSCSAVIVAASRDGSDFLLVRHEYFEASRTEETKLELWNEGNLTELGPLSGANGVALARSSASGSVFVFQSNAPFPTFKFNNGNGEYQQIYRYQLASNQLECLSCSSAGSAPTGNAELSHAFPSGLGNEESAGYITGNRGISADGSRVYFDTPSPLLAQDTNGVRDVYEWSNGTLSLISTGVSQSESFFGDNSPSGNDVFFSTAEGLAPGDTDEGYDVYDARIPRPGDQLPPSAVQCEGSVCQGPPSVPQLLGAPASETFNGLGNSTPPVQRPAKPTKHKSKVHQKKRKGKHARGKRAKRAGKSATRNQYHNRGGK